MICLEIYSWILRKLPTTSVARLSQLQQGFSDEKNTIDGFISGIRFMRVMLAVPVVLKRHLLRRCRRTVVPEDSPFQLFLSRAYHHWHALSAVSLIGVPFRDWLFLIFSTENLSFSCSFRLYLIDFSPVHNSVVSGTDCLAVLTQSKPFLCQLFTRLFPEFHEGIDRREPRATARYHSGIGEESNVRVKFEFMFVVHGIPLINEVCFS